MIAFMMLLATTGCGGGADASDEPASIPTIGEEMDYEDPRYTDEQVIEHMLGTTYADFDPANANARITVIQKKLADAEKKVSSVETSIRLSDNIIANIKKDLTYFPAGYLNWNEYRASEGDIPSVFKDKKEKRLNNETWYREDLDIQMRNAKFQVKLREAEIEYLKALAS